MTYFKILGDSRIFKRCGNDRFNFRIMKQAFWRFQKSRFSSLPSHGGQALQKFVKILSLDFRFWWWHLCQFLAHEKVNNVKVSIPTIIKDSQNLREEKKKLKRIIQHKVVCKVDNLLKPIVTNTLNFHQLCRNRSTYVAKVGCPF